MRTQQWFPTFLVCFVVPAVAAAGVQTTLYVAPDGKDDNPGGEAAPFATIEKARQAVRAINRQMTGDIVVVLRGGTYLIGQTIAFDPGDSGNGGHDVIYRAAPHQTPVISGGQRVTGWQKDEKGRWKAPAPVDNFRQLYVDGKRATRARGKSPAGLEPLGNDGYKTADVAMADWKNPDDLEICYQVVWSHTRCKVQSIKREGDRAIITMLQPYFTHARTKEGTQLDNNERPISAMYLENALELLDEPGQWYLDRKAKTVYYMPRPGEDLTKVEVIAPALEKLVELRGTLDKPVEHIRFEGITFEHGSWLRPSRIGHCEVQANFIVDSERKDSFVRDGKFANVHNENLKTPANVVLHAAKSIRFERCTFTRLGGAGLDVELGSQDNVVSGCVFHDIAASGVQIGDVLKDDHHPDDPRKIVKNNSVVNCYIHDCGLDYYGSVGVFAGYTEGTVIAHNEIARIAYDGISVGWGWGEEDAGGSTYQQPYKYDTPTPAKNNRIECNYVHHVVQGMGDANSIYTLGDLNGTVIRRNLIHDSGGEYGGIGLDEGSSRIEVTGNVVYRAKQVVSADPKIVAKCKIHDNFFGVAPDDPKAPEAVRKIAAEAGLESAYRDLSKKP
jgi:hypothetical protein